MTTDNFLNALSAWWPEVAVGGILALLLAAWLLRRKGRPHLASRVTAAATLLGLGWSAQGMWDTAVHHYHQDIVVASVLFVIFEAMLVSRMLKAHEYRTDFARRPKHIRAVLVVAGIMALVVALGEGPEQAPARLSIPLLVAYGWYVDLTADDDPKDKPKTSLRWTPRRLALAIGMLEAGESDVETINRDRLRNRMTRLAFKMDVGDKTLNDLLRRDERLRRLLTLADDADVAAVRSRIARSKVDLLTTEPVRAPRSETLHVPDVPRRRIPEAGKMGVHTRAGRTLRGAELREDIIQTLVASATTERPLGMPTAELRELYTPPLGQRTADDAAAAARKQLRGRVNGSAVI